MVLLLVDVCWCRGGVYINLQNEHFFRILQQNRVQNIIQCHDKNIWKRCVLHFYIIVLRPIFDTIYKGGKRVKIYMWALHHELVLFQQSRNCFCYVPENNIEGGILVWTTSKRWCEDNMLATIPSTKGIRIKF